MDYVDARKMDRATVFQYVAEILRITGCQGSDQTMKAIAAVLDKKPYGELLQLVGGRFGSFHDLQPFSDVMEVITFMLMEEEDEDLSMLQAWIDCILASITVEARMRIVNIPAILVGLIQVMGLDLPDSRQNILYDRSVGVFAAAINLPGNADIVAHLDADHDWVKRLNSELTSFFGKEKKGFLCRTDRLDFARRMDSRLDFAGRVLRGVRVSQSKDLSVFAKVLIDDLAFPIFRSLDPFSRLGVTGLAGK